MSDTVVVDATSLKRFFKSRFDIAVRVRSGKRYVEVWVPSLRRVPGEPFNAPIRYAATFPNELGLACAEVVYPGKGWCWCGNIGRASITMSRDQWVAVMAAVGTKPIDDTLAR